MQRKCACGNRADAGGECAKCRQKREGALQRAAVSASPVNDTPPIVHDVLRSSGRPLNEATRAFMEPRFAHDFSHVRVHTDAEAAESARAVNALAYTIGANVTFAAGQYQPTSEMGRRLLAHELTHVVQQRHAPAVVRGASLKVGAPGDRAEREADQVADALVSRGIAPPSIAPAYSQVPNLTLQRQPAKTTVRVDYTGSISIRQLAQGKGGSGAVVYDYPARAQKPPKDKDITKGLPFDITLPLLVYPPAILDPTKVDLFVFFHGMRADYGEGKRGKKEQGSEPIALWSHLQEAVAGTDRLGIAPQAPATWRIREKKWEPVTAQWHEALAKIGFDGLIKIALDNLRRDLGLPTLLVPGEIHVAGHSAGGLGIIEATRRDAGAKTYGDMVQDVTLQDAGYDFGWRPLMDWFLEGSPGKTVRVLISQAGATGVLRAPSSTSGSTSQRSTTDFLGEAKPGNNRVISGSTAVFEDKDLSKPTKQAPAGRGSKAKNLFLPRDTMVDVTALELEKPQSGSKQTTPRFIAKIKSSGVEGFTPLTSLAPRR